MHVLRRLRAQGMKLLEYVVEESEIDALVNERAMRQLLSA
jgi:hypothetical protein